MFTLRAVIYARISTQEQSVYSLETQIQECKNFIEHNGHELVEIYTEDGESAKNLNRPNIRKLMEDIKKKKFDLVVCWKLDRLTRDTVDGLTLIISLFKKKYGVNFVSITEDIKTETPDDIMMLTIRLSLAQAEREKIAERSSMGQVARARKGLRNSSAKPYGYDVNPADLSLILREDEARIVRQIFEWYTTGWGRFKIANELNSMGIPAPKGHIWYDFIIGVLIRNVIYTGATHYKPKKAPESERIIVPNQHEPIISEALFKLAQIHATRRADNTMNQSSHLFPFSTILKCALCGRSFHGKKKTKQSVISSNNYYLCSGKYRQHEFCVASRISQDKLTDLLFGYLDKFVLTDDNQPVSREKRDTEKERKQLEKELEDVKKKRSRLIDAMVDAKITYEDYTEKIIPIDVQIATLEKDIKKIKPVEVSSITRRDVVNNLKMLQKDWLKMDEVKRKQTVQSLFKRIVIAKVGDTWKIVGVELNI